MLKNIKIEALIVFVLLLNIFVSYNLDLGFYNYFSYFKDTLQQVYLKKFFLKINTLGDSLWYFVFSVFFIIFYYFFNDNKKIIFFSKSLKNFRNLNIFLFFSVLISGLITQIIKHIVGRPRPNFGNIDESYGLKFLTLDSNFHSFPSGHTSTIFAVALVLSLGLPKLKYVFLFLAGIVSFSRVVLGAHFITDIIGGAVVAFIGFKITIYFLSRYFKIEKDSVLKTNDFFVSIIFALFIISVFLAIGSTFDIYFGGLFYLGENQFLVQSLYKISIFFRKIVLLVVLLYVLVLPIISIFFPIGKIYFSHNFSIKEILYIWTTNIFSLLVFINLILKNFWGRVRPNEILELGGKNHFTPWYEISNQCSSNCSFVSGDAAVGFSLVVFYFLIKKEVYLHMALLFGFSIGAIRIMAGGHFLSDIILSGFFVFIINYLIYQYYRKNYHDKI